MIGPLHSASDFLIRTLFDIYTLLVLLRFILPWVGADFYNPVSQFLIKITEPPVAPFRALIPKIKQIDISILGFILLIVMLKFTILLLLNLNIFPNIFGLIVWSFADIINHVRELYFYAIIIVIILSWLQPHIHNPGLDILQKLTSPLLTPVRRIMPQFGGIDITPIPVLLGLKLIDIIFIMPFLELGKRLTLM